MNRVLVNPQILKDIADSIRGKIGSTDTIKLDEMASAIEDITVSSSMISSETVPCNDSVVRIKYSLTYEKTE